MPNTLINPPNICVPPPLLTISCIGIRLHGEATSWIQAVQPLVTDAECTRARRFKNAIDAALHLVARATVRKTLQHSAEPRLNKEFALTAEGKPYLPGSDYCFSISHSGKMVWIALCLGTPIGIDVERISPLPDLLELLSVLHPDETMSIREASPELRLLHFYRCWTRKEAVTKALGLGLKIPLRSFRVAVAQQSTDWLPESPIIPHDTTQCLSSEFGSKKWTTYDIICGHEYHCSVAAPQANLSLQISSVENPSFLI